MSVRHFKFNHCHIRNYTSLWEVKREFKGCITISGDNDKELKIDLENKAKRFASLVSNNYTISINSTKDDTELRAIIIYHDVEPDEYDEAKKELEKKKEKRAASKVVRSQKR